MEGGVGGAVGAEGVGAEGIAQDGQDAAVGAGEHEAAVVDGEEVHGVPLEGEGVEPVGVEVEEGGGGLAGGLWGDGFGLGLGGEGEGRCEEGDEGEGAFCCHDV